LSTQYLRSDIDAVAFAINARGHGPLCG
jgi:hypothetical protein